MAGPGAASSDQLVTEIPSMQPLVQSLQYTNQSTRPGQQCSNCQLYTAASQDRGKCQLFAEGVVNAGGWCASWVQKVAPTG
jgi:hypothetical protein